jgi:hypothetical protein
LPVRVNQEKPIDIIIIIIGDPSPAQPGSRGIDAPLLGHIAHSPPAAG